MVGKRPNTFDLANAMGDLEEEYNIKWNNHSHEALHVVNQLRTHDAFADVLLFCEDSWFKANKVILAACSGYFQNLFLEMQNLNQARAPAVVAMRETRSDLLQLALDFMYKGEVLVPSASLHDFMDFAEDMQIRGLRRDPGLPNAMPMPSPTEKNNNVNNNHSATRVASSSVLANGSPPAKKPRPAEPSSSVQVKSEDLKNPIVEVQSEDELENDESFLEMSDPFQDEDIPAAKVENSTGGDLPAYVPPDISTEDPVMRVTEVTWRGVHALTRAQWHFCGLCGYNARYQAALMRHERVHTGEKPFKCEMCDRRFTTKYWQQYHQRNSHPEVFGTSANLPMGDGMGVAVSMVDTSLSSLQPQPQS